MNKLLDALTIAAVAWIVTRRPMFAIAVGGGYALAETVGAPPLLQSFGISIG